MSKPGDNGERPEEEALTVLEAAVAKAVEQLSHMTRRVEDAEAKSTELEEVVKRLTGDVGEASRLLSRLQRLEDENLDLRERLHQGRDGVERLLAKVRFLENQR